jgi:rare lipoprotein A (peptidoglycan hydrolase)
LLAVSASFVLAPVLTSLMNPGSEGQVRRLSTLGFVSDDRLATTRAATTTTTKPAGELDLRTMLAMASPFYADPLPDAPAATPVPAAPAPAAAPPGPALPPPANRASKRRSQKGMASWYQIHNGTCAHVTLPKGTLVRVVNQANKKEIVCRVADRGPFLEGRIIDLDLDGFRLLADRSEGVIEVRINW